MTENIDVLLEETRKFEPPPEFRLTANVSSPEIYDKAERDPETFWAEQARELEWIKPGSKGLEWKPPHAQWFVGGKLNVAANCVDLTSPERGGTSRDHLGGEPGDKRTLTYWDLTRGVEVRECPQKLGVRKGDRVAIYLRSF